MLHAQNVARTKGYTHKRLPQRARFVRASFVDMLAQFLLIEKNYLIFSGKVNNYVDIESQTELCF